MTTKLPPIPGFEQHLSRMKVEVGLGLIMIHSNEPKDELVHDTVYGKLSFKVYDACPDSYTQVHLNGHKLYKVKTTEFRDMDPKVRADHVEELLNRDSFTAQVDKVLRHPI